MDIKKIYVKTSSYLSFRNQIDNHYKEKNCSNKYNIILLRDAWSIINNIIIIEDGGSIFKIYVNKVINHEKCYHFCKYNIHNICICNNSIQHIKPQFKNQLYILYNLKHIIYFTIPKEKYNIKKCRTFYLELDTLNNNDTFSMISHYDNNQTAIIYNDINKQIKYIDGFLICLIKENDQLINKKNKINFTGIIFNSKRPYLTHVMDDYIIYDKLQDRIIYLKNDYNYLQYETIFKNKYANEHIYGNENTEPSIIKMIKIKYKDNIKFLNSLTVFILINNRKQSLKSMFSIPNELVDYIFNEFIYDYIIINCY